MNDNNHDSRNSGQPAWLTDAHELHLDPGNAPELWSENYLTYVWSPANKVGIYLHLCRTIKGISIWNEQTIVALPGDRYLLAKGISKGYTEPDSLSVANLTFRCDQPFKQWTVTFHGGGRLISGDEYRAGPVRDGESTPMTFELVFMAMSLPFDFGTPHLDQAWGVGHYEQHGAITGSLSFAGESHQIDGTGLRDHSWGVRDYKDIGTTTWLHGQFAKSGRSIMAVRVTGLPPRPEFGYATVCTSDTITPVKAIGLPSAKMPSECDTDFSFQLATADGKTTAVSARILNSTRSALVGASEIALGTFKANEGGANHHYIDSFTEFNWDGEIGYGITERSVDLLSALAEKKGN